MSGLSNILKFIAILLCIAIMAGGIWEIMRPSTHCEKILERPITLLCVFIWVMSMTSLIGCCCDVPSLFFVSFIITYHLFVLFLWFSLFAFVITNNGAGEVVSGRGYKEYRLGDYSNLLQNRVSNTNNWKMISSCLKDNKVCHSLQDSNLTQAQFYEKNLSPIQSGCCKPPTSCGFTYVNANVWQKPGANTTFSDADCNTWGNDKNTLCYNCQSCKAGILANFKRQDYKRDAIGYFIIIICLHIIFCIIE
ncbi:tetraspanin-8-like [Tasmannia lanceolata]|uniref:tetraspanin-8-like n=1 Tax=Tasmannia lanceolata TaxID=3420 RepID=UPI00406425D4